ncbi:MAG: DeoR/GlpR transcriptional regulator [Planctomycetes bacterium]|nr:DeoR/GlpR transcriptional regulator [Planctomycetota bacterium]
MKTLRSMKIVDFLQDKKYCSIKELLDHFDVSPATIHRDVCDLARRKLIQKVRGGIAIVQDSPAQKAQPAIAGFAARIENNVAQKTVIAEKAVASIRDDDAVFLDSSTTSLHLAQRIQKAHFSRLTMITNSVLIMQEFHRFPSHFYLISLGGNFSSQLNSFLGKAAIEHLRRLRVSKAFVSGVGITQEGLFTYHEGHAEFLQEVLSVSEENCLLLDSSKFNRAGSFSICPLSSIDVMFSDATPPEYVRQNMEVCV